jgi:hypothetical protein
LEGFFAFLGGATIGLFEMAITSDRTDAMRELESSGRFLRGFFMAQKISCQAGMEEIFFQSSPLPDLDWILLATPIKTFTCAQPLKQRPTFLNFQIVIEMRCATGWMCIRMYKKSLN